MRVGQLRTRLTLEQPVRLADGAGGFDVTWTPVTGLWANVEPISGTEKLAFDRSHAAVSYRVTIRHRDDIAPDMRFVEGLRVLEIRALLDPGERGRWLECLCEERPQ